MAPILIDGWNFIRDSHSDIDDDEGDSLESAELLIEYIERFQETHQDPITIVFDSSREFLDLDHKNSPGLKVVPARDADEYIKRQIDKVPERQRKNLRVVSSDNEIYFYAKSNYATPLKCGDFWNKINRRDNTHER